MRGAIYGAALLTLLGGAARAEDSSRMLGSWFVIIKEDRFGGGGTYIATVVNSGTGLVVRCIERELSIAILDMGNDPHPLTPGDTFEVKFRIDQEPVVAVAGKAIGERIIQVETKPEMVKSIRKGKETAVRVENTRGVSYTTIFGTRGTPKAFERIAQECKLDEKPTDKQK